MEGEEDEKAAPVNGKAPALHKSKWFDKIEAYLEHSSKQADPNAGSMMPDVDEMKRRVRNKQFKNRYHVFDFYWENTWCAVIARHQWFERSALSVILLNTVYLAFDADYNTSDSLADAAPVFQICENLFCTFFTSELLIRFGAFQNKCNCFRDAWFVFDFSMCLAYVGETWIMAYLIPLLGAGMNGGGLGSTSVLRMLRLLRLVRVSRMARLLKGAPELMVLLKGILEASSSCIWTALLLGIAMYIWGLSLRHLSKDYGFGEKYFNSVPDGMFYLMMSGCFMKGLQNVMEDIMKESMFCTLVYFVFVVFAGVTVMKMLTGMLCKVVNAVAASEVEKMSVGSFKGEVLEVFKDLGFCTAAHTMGDEIESLEITHEMFGTMMRHQRALDALKKIGIDVVGLVEAAEFIFPAHEIHQVGSPNEVGSPKGRPSGTRSFSYHPLSFADFMENILEFRCTNTTTVKHMAGLRKFVRLELQSLEHKLSMHHHMYAETPCRSQSTPVRSQSEPAINEKGSFHNSTMFGVTGAAETSEEANSARMESEDVEHLTAESVLTNLCSLDETVERTDAAVRQMEQMLSGCKRQFSPDFPLPETSQGDIDFLMDDPRTYQHEVSFESGTRVMATMNIDYYRAGMQVPKGTLGTVVFSDAAAVVPRIWVDWDKFTLLDYAVRMLEYTEVPIEHVQQVACDIDVRPMMRVVVTSPIEDGFLKLKQGQEGIVVNVDKANGAFVDFADAGKHMIAPDQFANLAFEAERTRLLRLLGGSNQIGGHLRSLTTECVCTNCPI